MLLILEAEAIIRFIIVHITAVPLGQNFENVMSCIFTVVGDVRKHFPGCYALQLNYKKVLACAISGYSNCVICVD